MRRDAQGASTTQHALQARTTTLWFGGARWRWFAARSWCAVARWWWCVEDLRSGGAARVMIPASQRDQRDRSAIESPSTALRSFLSTVRWNYQLRNYELR